MTNHTIMVRTADGDCPVHVAHPDGSGPWPVVVVCMDALAIRPAMLEFGTKLAGHGYAAYTPDFFYRFGPYAPLDPKEVFAGDFRAAVGPMMATTDTRKAAADIGALLAHLRGHPDLRGDDVGTVGFCMGGGMALAAAGTVPDAIKAAASFHGGNLATDAPTSPHLFAPTMKAEVYVGGADEDRSYPPEMAQRLEAALAAANVRHRCEIYPGAQHGWMMPDFPIYDAAAAERGWGVMLDLFGRTLKD